MTRGESSEAFRVAGSVAVNFPTTHLLSPPPNPYEPPHLGLNCAGCIVDVSKVIESKFPHLLKHEVPKSARVRVALRNVDSRGVGRGESSFYSLLLG